MSTWPVRVTVSAAERSYGLAGVDPSKELAQASASHLAGAMLAVSLSAPGHDRVLPKIR